MLASLRGANHAHLTELGPSHSNNCCGIFSGRYAIMEGPWVIPRLQTILLGLLLLLTHPSIARSDSLYQASSTGDIEQVRQLIAEGAEVNLKYRCDAPLHAAAAAGQLEVVKLLIDAGADVNAYGCFGMPLHAAMATGQVEIARLLVSAGADVNAR